MVYLNACLLISTFNETRSYNLKEHKAAFSVVAESVWFVFCSRLKNLTSKISNLLLRLGAEGSRSRGLGAVNLDIPDTLVKSFGHEKYEKKLDRVVFASKELAENLCTYASIYVSNICLPLNSQKIDDDKQKYVADSNPYNFDL